MPKPLSSLLRRLLPVLTAPAPAPAASPRAAGGATYAEALYAALPGYAPVDWTGAVAGDADDPIDCIEDIVYAQVSSGRGSRHLRMTLLVPRSDSLKPCVVYFPGGGFTSAVHSRFIQMRMELARRGFVVAACEYRTVPDRFPAPLQDARAALRWLRAHAEQYGIDAGRVGVIGDSAGGYLVQMIGATAGNAAGFDAGDFLDQSSDVQAVCTLYGISDLTSIGAGFGKAVEDIHASCASTESLLVFGPAFGDSPGGSVAADREAALAASSLGNIRPGLPPFLIMHGSADRVVSPEQSARLYEALRKNGVSAEYVLVKGAGHSDRPWYQKPVIDRVADWFVRTLGAPKAGGGQASER